MIFATGLHGPEGPVILQDGSLLVVEMDLARSCITRISPDGSEKQVIAKTNGPNGQTIDRYGNIWVTDTLQPALVRVTMEGECNLFQTHFGDEAFLFPNDVVVGPDRMLYMTDSGILNSVFAPKGNVRPDYRSLSVDGRVYRIDPNTRKVSKIDSGLLFPNGLAFGPDGALYVAETFTGNIYRYPVRATGKRELFSNVETIGDQKLISGPDGIKFGANGYLYVATLGHGDITIIDTQGRLVERIKTRGRLPTNLTFGLPGTHKLYVTEFEFGCVEVFAMDTDGYHEATAQ